MNWLQLSPLFHFPQMSVLRQQRAILAAFFPHCGHNLRKFFHFTHWWSPCCCIAMCQLCGHAKWRNCPSHIIIRNEMRFFPS